MFRRRSVRLQVPTPAVVAGTIAAAAARPVGPSLCQHVADDAAGCADALASAGNLFSEDACQTYCRSISGCSCYHWTSQGGDLDGSGRCEAFARAGDVQSFSPEPGVAMGTCAPNIILPKSNFSTGGSRSSSSRRRSGGTAVGAGGDIGAALAQNGNWSEQFVFKDKDGDESSITFADRRAKWCSSSMSFGCKVFDSLALETVGPCAFQLVGGNWWAELADPPPGPRQQKFLSNLVEQARAHGVPVQGPGAEEVETLDVFCCNKLPRQALREAQEAAFNQTGDLTFPVPIDAGWATAVAASKAGSSTPMQEVQAKVELRLPFRAVSSAAAAHASALERRIARAAQPVAGSAAGVSQEVMARVLAASSSTSGGNATAQAGAGQVVSTGASLCVTIVERAEDCGCCAFSGTTSAERRRDHCTADLVFKNGIAEDGHLIFKVQVPDFLAKLSSGGVPPDHGHMVCVQARPIVPSILPGRMAEANASAASGSRRDIFSALGAPFVLGRLQYYYLPQVSFNTDITRIGIRTFLNPGWHEELRVPCTNCSTSAPHLNPRIAIRPLVTGLDCRGLLQQTLSATAAAVRNGELPANVMIDERAEDALSRLLTAVRQNGDIPSLTQVTQASLKSQGNALVNAATNLHASLRAAAVQKFAQLTNNEISQIRHCTIPARGPCDGPLEKDAFGVGLPADVAPASDDSEEDTMTFVVEGSRRLLPKERQTLFHHRSALCLYLEDSATHGWLVGFALVHVDGPDMQAFVGFVCFFGVALPLICLITALLHYNKYEQCRQQLQHLRLSYQREQLDRELAGNSRPSAATGAPAQGSVSASSSSSWNGGARSALVADQRQRLLLGA
eukprot:TRINITY_DN15544_c0_g1_i1.p1 TRINITY_DN15544_c0_g1~~TRINITY_DN15544_c0_g1_i1.p1  ORF type:complete len:849 (-),score=172.53 TRINITY_DN15544_c0_g1_i1:50-2596(-)